MKRSNILLLLICCLLVAGGVLLILRMEAASGKRAAPTPTPVITASPEPTATPEPEVTPSPEPVPEATATPEQTAAPTEAPTETPVVVTPTPEPTPQRETTGSFRSDTGGWLNLIVKWSVIPNGEGTKLRLEAYAESYSIETYKRVDDVEFNVGGTVKYDSSGPLNVDSPSTLVENKLGSAVFDVTGGSSVNVKVTWHFRGTYGNKDVDTVEAQQIVSIP